MHAWMKGSRSKSSGVGDLDVPQTESTSACAFLNSSGYLIIAKRKESKVEAVVSEPASIYIFHALEE